MHFSIAMFAAIVALVSVGEAAAIAPRGGEGRSGYSCSGCSGDGLNLICLDCNVIDISILDGILK